MARGHDDDVGTKARSAGNRSNMGRGSWDPYANVRVPGVAKTVCGSGSIEIGGLPWLDHKEAEIMEV